MALGKTVRELLDSLDSEELSEWIAYDQRWPLPDSWWQTARLARTIMAASGNYKKVPEEKIFIPSIKKAEQTQADMLNELMKLNQPQG